MAVNLVHSNRYLLSHSPPLCWLELICFLKPIIKHHHPAAFHHLKQQARRHIDTSKHTYTHPNILRDINTYLLWLITPPPIWFLGSLSTGHHRWNSELPIATICRSPNWFENCASSVASYRYQVGKGALHSNYRQNRRRSASIYSGP